MEHFLLTFGIVFVAELGDKTQLVAFSLATRFRIGSVALFPCSGSLLLVDAFR